MRVQPCFQIVKDGFGLALPGVHSLIRRLTPDFLLDATEFGNAFYGPLGDRRSLGFVDIDELAPYVGHAGADDPVQGLLRDRVVHDRVVHVIQFVVAHREAELQAASANSRNMPFLDEVPSTVGAPGRAIFVEAHDR